MKILHINTFDKTGGAAIAAYRLHKALINIGIESRILVQQKITDDYTVIGPGNRIQKIQEQVNSYLNTLALTLYSNRKSDLISLGFSFNKISKVVANINPDVVHLHWIANGFVDIKDIKKINKPIIWTLHDMWPFTGGCHYAEECNYYLYNCGKCPLISSNALKDITFKTLKCKKKAWHNLKMVFIAPSKWMSETASSSALLKGKEIAIINHGIDINTFKMIDKMHARSILNLPPDKKLILFGAINSILDSRKGFNILKESLQKLYANEDTEQLELIVFGASTPETDINFAVKAHYFGHLYDEITLSILYSAADVMIVPSKQESFGLTALEAMACGTPVVAFNATGLKDIVKHQETGYLAQPYDSDDLAKGIKWVFEDETRLKDLSINSRKLVEDYFDIKDIALKHKELYTKIATSCL